MPVLQGSKRQKVLHPLHVLLRNGEMQRHSPIARPESKKALILTRNAREKRKKKQRIVEPSRPKKIRELRNPGQIC
jgi:hypothetical protein